MYSPKSQPRWFAAVRHMIMRSRKISKYSMTGDTLLSMINASVMTCATRSTATELCVQAAFYTQMDGRRPAVHLLTEVNPTADRSLPENNPSMPREVRPIAGMPPARPLAWRSARAQARSRASVTCRMLPPAAASSRSIGVR